MIISLFLKLSISVYFQFYFLTKWKSPALGKDSNICYIFHREVENVILTKWPFNEKQAYKFSKSHPNVFVFEEFNLKIVEGQCFLSKLHFNCDNQSHHHHHYQRRIRTLRALTIILDPKIAITSRLGGVRESTHKVSQILLGKIALFEKMCICLIKKSPGNGWKSSKTGFREPKISPRGANWT